MSISLLIFILVLLVGTVATVIVDIAWGVCLYELLYFLYPVNRWWYTIPPFRYALFVGAILLIVYFFKRKDYTENKFLEAPQTKWFLFMLCMMVVISFYAVWPEQHYRFLNLQIKQLVFCYLAYKTIDTPSKFEKLIWVFLLGNFYIGYEATFLTMRDSFGRVEGIGLPDGPDANTTAAVLTTAVPLLGYFLLRGEAWKKVLAAVLLTFVLNGLILFNSRGSMLALLVGGAVFFFQVMRKGSLSGKERASVFIFLVFGVLAFFYLTDTVFWARMGTLKTVEVGEGDATRVNYWLAAVDLAQKHPFGVGARGFEYLSPQILPERWLSPESGLRAIHSTYFEALAEFGYAGIVLMSGFILSTLRALWRVRDEAKKRSNSNLVLLSSAFEASFICFMVASIFIDRLYAEVFYWSMFHVAIFYNIYYVKQLVKK